MNARHRWYSRWLQAVVVAAGLQLHGRTDLQACTCRGQVPTCQETWESDAAFVGRVTAVRSTRDGDDVDLDVLEAFRGVEPGPLRMARPMGTCSYGKFAVGRTYLVFAHGKGHALATTLCSGTRPLEEADEALAYLRGLASMPSRREGEMTGTVRAANSAGGWTPLADAPVAITGARGTIHAITDDSGRFSALVAPGTYVVRVDAPEGYEMQPTGLAPQLRDARGCVQADLYLRRAP